MTATIMLGGRPITERDAWAVLATANGVGPVGFARLVGRHGSALGVLEIADGPRGAERLVGAGLAGDEHGDGHGDGGGGDDDGPGRRPVPRLDLAVAESIVAATATAPVLLDRVAELGLDVLTLDDGDYPPLVLAVAQPPPVLFVRGDRAALSAANSVAVVGTRRPTEAGRRLGTEIGATISLAGGVVISGLALGIDAAAHAGAVSAGRPTVAVLGTGHGRLYPAGHAKLAADIVAEGGCIVSEFGPDIAGTHWSFPRRNAVISGLATATIVVEAPVGSGALITAERAIEQGRECFLVPGPLGAPTSEGCINFLRAFHGQARIVASVPALLEDLGFVVNVQPGAKPAALGIGATESAIASLVVAGNATVDSLVAATRLPVSTVLSALTLLEMRGLVAAAYGRYRPHGALVPRIGARRRHRCAP